MNRKVLLIEPNYKNKYPPMGLMKIATYYKMLGDDVRFFKGNLSDLALDIIYEDLINHLEIIRPDVFWRDYYLELRSFLKKGSVSVLIQLEQVLDEITIDSLKEYRRKYKEKDFFLNPRFDKVGITTLFTFYWDISIETINFAKQLCKNKEDVMVGGVMASILPEKVYEATGIHPFVGQLSHPGDIDDNDIIIDTLPLDYSILDEIDYSYPVRDAYFAYMTRGCVNHCSFCAVPKLEPEYKNFIGIKNQIENTNKRFGAKRDLLLLDNNVLASECYEKIIDEIIECGFGKNAKYLPPDEYEITINNLKDHYNDRAFIRKAVSLYHQLLEKIKEDEERTSLYSLLEKHHCLHWYTASWEEIISLDEYVRPLWEMYLKPKTLKRRIVDFNQGIDSRLITVENMEKLSKVSIYPCRIAFDHWELRDIYEQAVRRAVKSGITSLSNYLLYNFKDKPEELYYRMRLNVDLCEELGATIYSFPMKYHPIDDPEYFSNRDYIGKNWNRKFIRAIQAVLNSTKGKIGKGVDFFEEAFGCDVEEFRKILWMPETFIIYRRRYDADLRKRLSNKYKSSSPLDCDLANEWWEKFRSLSPDELKEAQAIISLNKFGKDDYHSNNKKVMEVIKYYQISR